MSEYQIISEKKVNCHSGNGHKIEVQKKMIIGKLKEQGSRITKQRLTIIDIILENDCSCCKETNY